jgi:EAL domain-containing protein (putative c-di-GMP-specific phosphodiesterase class I)
MRTPVTLAGRQLQVHASAGIAIGSKNSTAMDLMRDADVAMYEAKSHGKDQAETYQPTMHSQIVQSYQLRTELAEAIAGGQFVLNYQPAVRIATGEIVGAEALVRWHHPERGVLPPGEFIQHAESSGLIHDLGRWILNEACQAAAGWPDLPNGDRPAISVNITAGQLLRPSFVDEVTDVLAATGLAAELLFLEVTESALVNLEPARLALQRLRDAGVGLALDDFGTGYSALSYLAALPFHVVKIDRSFIASAAVGEREEALLRGIVGLCDALQLIVVAEGIEDEQQLERVSRLGCLVGQGYFFARPQPSAAFTALYAPPGADQPAVRPLELGGLPGLASRRGVSAAG